MRVLKTQVLYECLVCALKNNFINNIGRDQQFLNNAETIDYN